MEDIIEFMDESRCDKLLQRHLGKSVDIQRIPAHKQVKALDLFRLTLRICAVEGLHIIHTADLRRPPQTGQIFGMSRTPLLVRLSEICGMIMFAL